MTPFDRLLSVPAHVHYVAYLMKDPPTDSREAYAAFEPPAIVSLTTITIKTSPSVSEPDR